MSNLDTALERARSAAPSTLVQGHRFERMFRAAHREAAEVSRRASQALSLELATAVQAGVTGYRLGKWLGVADSAVRKRLRQADKMISTEVV